MRKLDAYKLYLGLMFFNSFFFSMIFVVASFYEATVAGLTGLQLVLVGTTVELTILLFEIPTGIVADAYSRRLSIIIGYFIMGWAFIVEGSFPAFLPIVLAQILWGIGYTFTSGATQAWLSDEIGESNANRAFMRGNQFDLAGALLGMLVAIPLGNLAVNLPILAGGVAVSAIAIALALLMPEHGFHPVRPEDRNTWQHMGDIFKKGLNAVRARPTLMAILGVGLIYGLYSEGWDRLWVKYLVDHFTLPSIFGMNEVAFFGLLRAGGMILSILASRLVEKRLDTNHPPTVARAMMVITALLAASIFTFAFSPALAISIAAVWLVSIARNVMDPLYNAWVNQRLDSDTRATVISMSGQVDAIGQVASGPLAGLVSLWSVQAAITFASLLITPALPLIARANRLHVDEKAPVVE
ncbi:MAG TPA: MFS transporter [Anaerolineales bacterium]|jgi:DHA3 family tetracycline resistance protein-like MFS transporter